MLAWLSVWSKVQTCIWPGWCHCHSLSVASVKSRLVLPFWYRLTQGSPWQRAVKRVCISGVCHYARLVVANWTCPMLMWPRTGDRHLSMPVLLPGTHTLPLDPSTGYTSLALRPCLSPPELHHPQCLCHIHSNRWHHRACCLYSAALPVEVGLMIYSTSLSYMFGCAQMNDLIAVTIVTFMLQATSREPLRRGDAFAMSQRRDITAVWRHSANDFSDGDITTIADTCMLSNSRYKYCEFQTAKIIGTSL